MNTARTQEQPTYLVDYHAPVPDEIEAFDLRVTGTLPAELTGRYIRNGPNPPPGTDPGHGFSGDGMLHGVALRGGRAEWYRNRWVRTAKLAGEPLWTGHGRDLSVNSSNTHIISHGGALLALCEGGLPYRVTEQLETVGAHDFGGRLTTAMTAHPKEDPVTGELLFYGYSTVEPYLTFHIANADGELVHSAPVDVPGPTMMHDFAITENYVLWLDLPVVFDAARKSMPYDWDDDYGARIGMMARAGGAVRWFDIDPCYVFHVGNAREDGQGRIVLDGVRYSPETFISSWRRIGGDAHVAASAAKHGVSRLYRWTLDPRSGTVLETALDDRAVEFPSLHDGYVGRANRYLYSVSNAARARIVKYDTVSLGVAEYSFDEADFVGEAVFIPARGGTAEDDGWLVSIITPGDGGASSMVILDATDVGSGPVATVHLPRRVPAGFHGSWIQEG